MGHPEKPTQPKKPQFDEELEEEFEDEEDD